MHYRLTHNIILLFLIVGILVDLPSFFHCINNKGSQLGPGTSSFIDQVGSAQKRRLGLFHVLFKSLCSAGRPVLLTNDDIHWAKIEGMKDLIWEKDGQRTLLANMHR